MMWLLRLAILGCAAIWFGVVAAWVEGSEAVRLAIVVVLAFIVLPTVLLFLWAADDEEELG